MDTKVSWVLEVAVKRGRLAAFRELMEEMVAATRTESGALGYEWFVSDDGGVVYLAERYADSAAILAHLGTFGERFAARFLAEVDPTRFTVMGCPSDAAKAALSGVDPAYLQPFGGFVREVGG
jgi:quinol monooxygenase YgiN